MNKIFKSLVLAINYLSIEYRIEDRSNLVKIKGYLEDFTNFNNRWNCQLITTEEATIIWNDKRDMTEMYELFEDCSKSLIETKNDLEAVIESGYWVGINFK